MKRSEIAESYPDALLLDPEYFDDAIVGIIHDFNRTAVCYSESKIIELLMSEDKMDYDEALEYYQYNILGAWMGDWSPMYLETL